MKYSGPLFVFILFATLFCLPLQSFAQTDQFALVRDGVSRSFIVVKPGAPRPAHYAAQEHQAKTENAQDP